MAARQKQAESLVANSRMYRITGKSRYRLIAEGSTKAENERILALLQTLANEASSVPESEALVYAYLSVASRKNASKELSEVAP